MTHRILIVDNDSSFRALCIRLLRKRSTQEWLTAEAADGGAAIDVFRKEVFDCVLIDYRLSDMLGTELIPLLRQESEREVPMILLSAEDLEQTIGNAAFAGASRFISKSNVSGLGLANVVEEVLLIPQNSCREDDQRVAEN